MLRRLCKDVRFKEEIVLTKKEIKWLNQQHQIYFSWDFLFFLITISLVSAWILPRWQMPFCDWWKNAFDSTLQICSNFNVSTRGSEVQILDSLLLTFCGELFYSTCCVCKRDFFTPSSLSFVVSCFPDVKIIFFFLFTQWYKCNAVTENGKKMEIFHKLILIFYGI